MAQLSPFLALAASLRDRSQLVDHLDLPGAIWASGNPVARSAPLPWGAMADSSSTISWSIDCSETGDSGASTRPLAVWACHWRL